jgi:CheY-like chemotaxis protein
MEIESNFAGGLVSMTRPESETAVFAINAASELTGVPVTTLRSWENNFGVVRPLRTAGGHRLYSQEDIERLRWLKDKIDSGIPASVAHRLLRDELVRTGGIAQDARRRGGVMILVAERDPITADLERYFLESEGYEVRVVLDGRTAVQEAVAMQPDLIIVDVILPGVNGLQVCRSLKANPATADTPVVVFSVLDVRERALEAGADAFLLKPLEQPVLIGLIRDMVAQRDAGPVRGGT